MIFVAPADLGFRQEVGHGAAFGYPEHVRLLLAEANLLLSKLLRVRSVGMVFRVNVESGLLIEGGCQLDEAYGGVPGAGLRGRNDPAVLVVPTFAFIVLKDRELDAIDGDKAINMHLKRKGGKNI